MQWAAQQTLRAAGAGVAGGVADGLGRQEAQQAAPMRAKS
jgi:hypothetical protein